MRKKFSTMSMALAALILGGCAMQERDEAAGAATQGEVGVTGKPIEEGKVYGAPPGPTPGISAVEDGVRGGTGAPGGGEASEKLGPPIADEAPAAEGAPAQGAPANESVTREQQAPHGAEGAAGAPGMGGANGVFQRLDENKDGMISRTEAGMDPKTSEIFQQADRDNNGFLSPSEFWSVHQ